MNKKLVITGMGAITPIGLNVNDYWKALKEGKSGIDKITKFDTENYNVKVAAEVKGFCAENYMTKKLAREMDLFMQYAYAAADEAIKDSGINIEPGNTGIVLGTAMNGVTSVTEAQAELTEKDNPKKVSPRLVPKYIGNIGAAQIAIARGITGPSVTVETACSSGVDAISLAAMFIETGASDTMIAVGADSAITPLIISALANVKALSSNPDPKTACRPFDLNRDGFVMGEGGGAIVIETEEHAKKRGAKIYAELAGYANNTDGHHVTSPHPEGIGAVKCMKDALNCAGMKEDEIQYINTHGTSTPGGDIIEVKAISQLFGENAPLISSTKSATGHLMGAGGVTETIACVMAVRENIVPPTLNYETPDERCNLNCVPNKAVETEVNAAMSNAFGFGGQNASVIVRKYNG